MRATVPFGLTTVPGHTDPGVKATGLEEKRRRDAGESSVLPETQGGCTVHVRTTYPVKVILTKDGPDEMGRIRAPD